MQLEKYYQKQWITQFFLFVTYGCFYLPTTHIGLDDVRHQFLEKNERKCSKHFMVYNSAPLFCEDLAKKREFWEFLKEIQQWNSF